MPGFFWTPHYMPSSCTYFNLYSFTLVNHNNEDNSFSKFCESWHKLLEGSLGRVTPKWVHCLLCINNATDRGRGIQNGNVRMGIGPYSLWCVYYVRHLSRCFSCSHYGCNSCKKSSHISYRRENEYPGSNYHEAKLIKCGPKLQASKNHSP